MNEQIEVGDWVECINLDDFCTKNAECKVGECYRVLSTASSGRGLYIRSTGFVTDVGVYAFCFQKIHPFQAELKQRLKQYEQSSSEG